MVNYRNGKIYRIDCITTGQVYIGATTKTTLAQRLTQHRSLFKQWKEGKTNYTTSFKIIEQDNFVISLIEECPCNSKDELSARENYYIRTIDCVNKHRVVYTDDFKNMSKLMGVNHTSFRRFLL